MMAGNWRKSPSSRNLILRFMEMQAMSFHNPVSSCVISSATSQSMLQYPFRTVDGLLHAEVLHGGVGLRDDLDLVPFFPEGGHDLARQVGFPGARVPGQQQASTGTSSHRYTGMPSGCLSRTRPELFGQVLEDDAVRFDGLKVPRRRAGSRRCGLQCIPPAAPDEGVHREPGGSRRALRR